MADFKKNRWADSDFSENYREAADIFMPFRRRTVEIVTSCYSFFIKDS